MLKLLTYPYRIKKTLCKILRQNFLKKLLRKKEKVETRSQSPLAFGDLKKVFQMIYVHTKSAQIKSIPGQ